MEEKHILRDIFYLGVGSVAIATNKTEELLNNFVNSNKVNAKEGERIVKEYTKKAEQAKNDMMKKQEEFVNLLKDKLDMRTDEIKEFYNKMMAKPGEAKQDLQSNIDKMATQLSENTQLTIEQGRKIFESFIDNMIDLQSTIKSRSQESLGELQSKAKEMRSYGADFLEEMDQKTKELREEVSKRTQSAVENFKNQLHMASTEDVDKLGGRVDRLEKKVFETKR